VSKTLGQRARELNAIGHLVTVSPEGCSRYKPCRTAQYLEAQGERDRGGRDQQITRLEAKVQALLSIIDDDANLFEFLYDDARAMQLRGILKEYGFTKVVKEERDGCQPNNPRCNNYSDPACPIHKGQ
jgi:hypothetical protein